MQERDIFIEALQQQTAADRATYLSTACGADADLRHRVEQLLVEHDRQESFILDSPAVGLGPGVPSTTLDPPLTFAAPGTVIGRYKILEPIGEGGYGTVFMAEQTSPVQRKVALKIIKAGMDTRQVIARFEAERQALALMDHPNIAKVHDAGVSEKGRPYFVMELVRGLPITKYCDEHKLRPKQRLELFVQVCHAVQHAHQKGIIHRDLKPSNVLVAQYDGKPVPKVIDFGVAKATGQRLTERTMFTGFGDVIGTLEYMSPEQAEVNQLDVDTRSDIYSLGVLLYELLTGSTPLERKRVMKAGLLEMLRVVREEEPPKPSMRLNTTEQLASISANRGVEPKKLSGLLKGELDWIVMKALEKDRARRYETAVGFGRDVERYLNDEPVQACPPSAGYRLRKFVQRNKGPVLAGAALVTFLLLGTVGTSIGLVWALRAERAATAAATGETRQRREAETQRDRAISSEKQAIAEKKRADDEAAVAQAVNDFLQLDLLAQATPELNARDKRVTVEEVLGRAASRLPGKFERQPRVEAAIRLTVGSTYFALGDYPAAQPHLERALDLRRRVLGEEHLDTLTAMNNLALLYESQGEYAKAETLLVKTLEVRRRVLGEENRQTLNSVNNLAELYQDQRHYSKAEPLLTKALEVTRCVLGDEHLDTLTAMNNLAVLYKKQGQYAKAEPLLVKTLEVSRRVKGEEHPHTFTTMGNLAELYQAQGQYPKAEPLFVKALEVCRRVMGEEHPHTLIAMTYLARLYWEQHQYAKAETLYIKSVEASRRVLGEQNPNTLMSMNWLGKTYQAQGQLPRAELIFREVLKKLRQRHGEPWAVTADTLCLLGGNLNKQQQYTEAETVLRECLTIREEKEPESYSTFETRSRLGGSLLGQKKYAEAEPLLLTGYEGMKVREGETATIAKDLMTEAVERLAQLYDAWNKKDQADEWRKKLEARRK